MKSLLTAISVMLTVLALHAFAFAQIDAKEVLVLDFIGFHDKGKNHANTFRETVLPNASLVGIGIHGIIPDAWRENAGYDAIVRAQSERDYERSADEVHRLIKHGQTILSFDFNEEVLPRQLRLKDKTLHPAMVAAKVAERWRQEHPNGVIILRGHSDGTYADLHIFDYLKDKGIPPQAVILESPRQPYEEWAKRAKVTSGTFFLSITSTADLSRSSIIDKGYANIPSENWVNLHVQSQRERTLINPLEAHGVVTEYQNAELGIQKTDFGGQTVTQDVSLGVLVKKEFACPSIRSFLTPPNPSAMRSNTSAPVSMAREPFPLFGPKGGTNLFGESLPPLKEYYAPPQRKGYNNSDTNRIIYDRLVDFSDPSLVVTNMNHWLGMAAKPNNPQMPELRITGKAGGKKPTLWTKPEEEVPDTQGPMEEAKLGGGYPSPHQNALRLIVKEDGTFALFQFKGGQPKDPFSFENWERLSKDETINQLNSRLAYLHKLGKPVDESERKIFEATAKLKWHRELGLAPDLAALMKRPPDERIQVRLGATFFNEGTKVDTTVGNFLRGDLSMPSDDEKKKKPSSDVGIALGGGRKGCGDGGGGGGSGSGGLGGGLHPSTLHDPRGGVRGPQAEDIGRGF